MSVSDSFINKIESLPEIREVVTVLKELEKQGLERVSIGGGWIRSWVTNTVPNDIDIQYSGSIPPKIAQEILTKTLKRLGINPSSWDIEGIWNTFLWTGINPDEYYLLFFIDSIDSLYLASDGKIHDPTGYGLGDAKSKTLRMNDFQKSKYPYTHADICYLCIRGCERITKLNWTPTKRSEQLLRQESYRLKLLSDAEKEYLAKDYIINKYQPHDLTRAQKLYDYYGWGDIFNAI